MLVSYRNHDELDRLIEEWTKGHEPYEIMHLLQKEGIPCCPLLSEGDALSDPRLKERAFFLEFSHPHPGFLWKMSQTPPVAKNPAPCLGEHNDYVYRELLGKGEEEITQLKKEGHISTEYSPEVI